MTQRIKHWRFQFSLRTLLLIFIPVALIAYTFKPGHLISGNVVVDYCAEFDYIRYNDGSGLKHGRICRVRVINKSGNPVWYIGEYPGYPINRLTNQFVDGKWTFYSDSTSYSKGYKIRLDSGESFNCVFPVYDNSTRLRVGLCFASRWFGPVNHTAWSSEILVRCVDQSMRCPATTSDNLRDEEPNPTGRK